MKPEITVVIGTLNRPKVVLSLLDELIKISIKIPLKVIVFDQSLPEEYRQLKVNFPTKVYFSLNHLSQPNTCKYLNLGWQQANASLVLYLDDDVSITESAIRAHIDAYRDTSIKGVAGRVINNNETTNSTETRVGKILWYGAEFIKNFSSKLPTYVDFPYGCNMSFRTKTLQDIGGFDNQLAPPIYAFNEIDMGYRINKRWKNSIAFVPKALAYHFHSKEGGTRNNFNAHDVLRSNQFNYGYFLGKNFSWVENSICFIRRLVYQILHEPYAIRYILEGFMYAKRNS